MRKLSGWRACAIPLALLFCVPATGAQKPAVPMILHNYHFSHFDVQGLEIRSATHAVHRDSRGRLWLGTETGLYLYDGNNTTRFDANAETRGNLPHYFAKAVEEGPDGRVWVGTWGGGIAYFDEDTRQFVTPELTLPESDDGKPFDLKVWSMDVDGQGRVWIGSFTSGLFRFDPADGSFINVYRPAAEESSLYGRINSVHADHQGRVWFAPSRLPVSIVDTDSLEILARITVPDHFGHYASDRGVYDIEAIPGTADHMLASRFGLLRVSPDGETVALLKLERLEDQDKIMEALPLNEREVLIGTAYETWHVNLRTGEHFRIPSGDWAGAIPTTIIWDMDLTEQGDILLSGTTGVWLQPATRRKFWTLTLGGNQPGNLIEARAIEHDGSSLYVNGGGQLYRIPEFPAELGEPTALDAIPFTHDTPDRMLWLEGDPESGFWAGTDQDLFHVGKDGSWKPVEKASRSVHVVLRDDKYDRILTQYTRGIRVTRQDDPSSSQVLPGSRLREKESMQPAITMDFGPGNDIWVGTFSGIHRFDRESLKPLPVFDNAADTGDWSNPFTNFFDWLPDGSILIGGTDGLYRGELAADGSIARLRKMFADTELGSIGYSGSLRISENEFLMTSGLGLIWFDAGNNETQLLAREYVSPLYNPYSGVVRQFGNIAVLSGHEGPLLLQLDEIGLAQPNTPLIISDVMSFRGNTATPWPIRDKLEFLHSDQVIRFRFGLLDPLRPEDNNYRIQLEGFNENWLDIGQLNEFSFTNLDAGNYTLKVEGRDGTLGEPVRTSLSFSVLPPWWETWWAYTLYAFLTIGSLLAYFLHLRRKLKREQDITARLREADKLKTQFLSELEIKVDEATAELRHAVEALEIKNVELEVAQNRAQDASRLKSEFLANMSHEIRTPMNGVIGFAQLLRKSSLDADQAEYVDTIDSSAHSLLGIINDILDLSKIEAGKLIIDQTGFNLRNCVSETLETLSPVAYEKQLDLILEVSADLPTGVRGDPVRLRQVLTNLVGNAIKFTDSGSISVRLRPARLHGKDAVELVVSDTGRGISEEDRKRLFRAFERGSADVTSKAAGTGLGLVITKKLTEAMGGEISLDSELGKGTVVSMKLPMQADRNPENRYEDPRPLLGRNVHLVDGVDNSRAGLHELLQSLGAEVHAAERIDDTLLGDADILALGFRPAELDELEQQLQRVRERIGDAKSIICFIPRIDRSAFTQVAEKFDVLCLPKLSKYRAVTRRLEDWLRGYSSDTESAGEVTLDRSLAGTSVFIADDNRINRFFLRKMLETHGARVHEAVDGKQALEMLTGDAAQMDIALVDLHMPELNGLDVAERARAAGVSIPMLVVSANVMQETRDAATAAGFDDYLLKPVDEEALLDALHRHRRS